MISLYGFLALLWSMMLVNLSTLALAKQATRRVELGTYAALGASRGQMMRQELVAPLVLGAVGYGLGVLLARIGLVLLTEQVGDYGLSLVPTVEWPEAAIALLAAALMIGVLVAWPLVAVQRSQASSHRWLSVSKRRGRIVGIQIGVSTALLAVAVGTVVGNVRSPHLTEGIDLRNISASTVSFTAQKWDRGRAEAAQRRIIDALGSGGSQPAVGFASGFPIGRRGMTVNASPAGSTEAVKVNLIATTPNTLAILGVPVLAGSLITLDVDAQATPLLVSETTARNLFPGQSAIGRLVVLETRDLRISAQVVGVVADVRQARATPDFERAVAYVSTRYLYSPEMFMVFRSDYGGSVSTILGHVALVEPELVFGQTGGAFQLLNEAKGPLDAIAATTAVLAGVIGLLSVAGLAGVISVMLELRARDLAIRRALGASTRSLIGTIASEELRFLLPALVSGAVLAGVIRAALGGALFNGVWADEGIALVGSIGAMLGLSLVGIIVPILMKSGPESDFTLKLRDN